MTTYYLLNSSKRYDAMMKKIKAVAKQTKARILSMDEEIKQETKEQYEGEDSQGKDKWRIEQVPYTVTRVVIG
jgi:hypothetical protein